MAASGGEVDKAFEEQIYELLLEEGDNGAQPIGGTGTVGGSSSGNGTCGTFLDNIVGDFADVRTADSAANASVRARTSDKHNSDREAKRARNSGDLHKQEVRDPNAPFDVLHANKKNIAEGLWCAKEGVVELVTLRGNFWRVMGFTNSKTKKQILNPEEALLLVEKSQLIVRPQLSKDVNKSSSSKPVAGVKHIPSQYFYQEVLQVVPQACILTFVKLKFLDYVTLRHNRHNGNDVYPLRAFGSDAEVYEHMKAHPTWDILETLVSFDVYPNISSWSKKLFLDDMNAKNRPCGHVVVQTGDWTMNSRLVMHLLKAANGVPIIFAAVLNSGNLVLEEFTDATTSLVWDNEHAIDISFNSNVSMDNIVKRKVESSTGGAAAKAKNNSSEASDDNVAALAVNEDGNDMDVGSDDEEFGGEASEEDEDDDEEEEDDLDDDEEDGDGDEEEED